MATNTKTSPAGTQVEAKAEVSDLTRLLRELKVKMSELKIQLQTIIRRYKDGEIKTSKGVSFLEVKYQIMLQYITQLAFFVHLKLSGKKVEGHPVIESLVELRVILEKMKPIESKLKYQIDKLVRTAVIGSQGQENGTQAAIANDPLSFKPNPMNLLNREDEEDEDDEEEGLEGSTADGKSGIYRPPKLAPVAYNEAPTKKSKYEKDQQRLREKASRSRIMQDLMAEMNDRPEEIDALGGVNEGTGYGDRLDRMIQEKKKYEEDNYVRLTVTRKERKRLDAKKRMRFEDEFENLNDFSNLIGLQEVDEEQKRLKKKKYR